MTAMLHARVARQRALAVPRDRLWAVLADVDHLDRVMPEVHRYERTNEGYRWTLAGRSAFGVHLRPIFVVRYILEPPHRLVIDSVPGDRGNAESGGEIVLTEVDGATLARIALTIALEAPIPRLARPAANALLVDELERLGEGFLGNLERAAR